MRKKYYEINVAYRGAVDTITLLTKKEKNAWLINYFTQGDGRSWATQRHRAYLDSLDNKKKKKITFEKFILRTLKDKTRIILPFQNKVILIREKYF